METTLKTNFGELTFGKDAIIIEDKISRNSERVMLIISPIWLFIGVLHLSRVNFHPTSPMDWLYVLVIIVYTFILLNSLRLSYQEHIPLHEINTVKLRSFLGAKFLEIKLKNGKVRQVKGVRRIATAIKQYINTNYPQ